MTDQTKIVPITQPTITRIVTPVRLNVASDTIVATRAIDEAVAALEELGRQEKTLEMTKKALQAEVKAFMGDCEKLLGINGALIATWNWIKGTEGINKKALMQHFADVYEIVKTLAAPTRRF